MFGIEDSLTSWASVPTAGDDATLALPATTDPAPPLAPVPTMEQQSAPMPTAVETFAHDPAARRGAGMAVVLSAAGLTAGWFLAGTWGAGAGFVLVGAARNGLRAKQLWSSAQAGDREEAAKSATMAAIGAAVGGYLAYRAHRARNGISAEE